MGEYKAKYVGSTPYEKNYYNQHWEYRGHQYIVTVPIGWSGSSDYYNSGYMSQKNQHDRSQREIDHLLDDPDKETQKTISRNAADDGFDILWSCFEGVSE